MPVLAECAADSLLIIFTGVLCFFAVLGRGFRNTTRRMALALLLLALIRRLFMKRLIFVAIATLVSAPAFAESITELFQKSQQVADALGMTETQPAKRLEGCDYTWAFSVADNSPSLPESAPLPVGNLFRGLLASASGSQSASCVNSAPDSRDFKRCELPSEQFKSQLRWRYSNDGKLLIQFCIQQ